MPINVEDDNTYHMVLSVKCVRYYEISRCKLCFLVVLWPWLDVSLDLVTC